MRLYAFIFFGTSRIKPWIHILNIHKCFPHIAVLSGSGREGGGGQSQGFPGEQHLFCWRPLHNGPVCIRLGSATQPLRPAGPAPPQPHGNYARYRHTHHCVQHDQQVTGGSFIQSLVTWTTDVSPGDRQRPDCTTRKNKILLICGNLRLIFLGRIHQRFTAKASCPKAATITRWKWLWKELL